MKPRALISLVGLLLCLNSFSQQKKPIFLGIQPAITKEKFYDKNEFDANVLPFVVELPLNTRINLRFASILNYHFGNTNKISDVGIQTVFPVFLKKQISVYEKSSGFYLAPVLGFGRNLINDHYTTTLAIEPGYLFQTKNRFTLSLGIQYGGSHFKYTSDSKWVEHFGVKVNLGFWL